MNPASPPASSAASQYRGDDRLILGIVLAVVTFWLFAVLRRMGPRKPMLLGCWITGAGILLTTLTFLLVGQYLVMATVGFTPFTAFALGHSPIGASCQNLLGTSR